MRKLFVILLSFSTVFSFSQQGKEKMLVTDLLRIKSAGAVSLSPDGSKAVFTVTSIEPESENKWEYKYVTGLWLANTDGSSAPRQITGKEGSSQPVWSPDGKQIAFVRAADGRSQIWLLSLEGGEAQQLTSFKYGAGNPKWSPDGKEILFSAFIPLKDLLKDSMLNPGMGVPAWPFEKPGFDKNEQLKTSSAKPDPDGNIAEVRAYLENNVADRKAKVLNKLNFQQESAVSSDIGFSHFFIVNSATGKNPIALTKGFYSFSGADFTPDGRQLVLSGDTDSTQNADRKMESEIYTVNKDGSNLRLLLAAKGKSYSGPVVSPLGKWLAFQYGTASYVSISTLGIMPLNGTAKDIIEIPFDRNKSGLTWSKDEKYLYFTAQSNGGAPVFRVDVKSKQVEQLSEANGGVASFDFQANKLAYVKTTVESPYEFYVADANGKNEKRLSALNSIWIKSKKLSMPEKHEFVNEKGLKVEYWVMKPTNYEPGKKFPLLLEIHGGPAAMWGPGESSMWHEFQYFCSKGYGVVYSNPRGSGGYGMEFLRGNLNDWGTGPASDVLTVLDKTVAEGWADTSKLLVTGGSYAGYLVAWLISHDNRFKAACAQRGVYDLSTFFGEGNAWRLVPNYFGGYPWQEGPGKILERESPINYVDKINTPFIIFHGENDLRTGVIQSEMLYKSLKVLGKPVEYVRHPGGTHELTRSGNNRQRIDQMLRTWEFFNRYIF